jgi:cob(I)alamin adenosyltransferase
MPNRLTKITTKTGDDGTTSLANNKRTGKIDPRIYAIGDVDEANSAIGNMGIQNDIVDSIQQDLFTMGAVIAGSNNLKITEDRVQWLEAVIEDMNSYVQPLTTFILPKGPIHLARAVVRRAERTAWYWYATDMEGHASEDLSSISTCLVYLNRLSDLLFVMARHYNENDEQLWKVQ